MAGLLELCALDQQSRAVIKNFFLMDEAGELCGHGSMFTTRYEFDRVALESSSWSGGVSSYQH